MKIEKFELNKRTTQTKGVSELKMERLGSVVALVGKNGSGKTRILDLLENQYIQNLNYNQLLTNDFINIPEVFNKRLNQNSGYKQIVLLESEIQELERERQSNPADNNLQQHIQPKDLAIPSPSCQIFR